MREKSVVLAVILAVLFGPLGLLYSTVLGAFLMLAVNVMLVFVFPPAMALTWLACVIWAGVAANNYNNS